MEEQEETEDGFYWNNYQSWAMYVAKTSEKDFIIN